MAKRGGEAAGRPAGAGLCRVTHHDKIISSAGHRGHCCCCYRGTDTSFPSLSYFLLISLSFIMWPSCVASAVLLFVSNSSMLKALFTMLWTVAGHCVWTYAAGRGGALSVGYCSCCGLWLVLHLHGLCNLSLKDYCWFLAGRGNLCTRD